MTDRATLVKALRILAREIDSQDGAANAVCEEAANVIEERRWIPVGERLPEEGKSVLVLTTRGEVEVAGYETFANGNLWWTMSSGDPVWVTKWMPLPAPPKGGEVE